MPWHRSDHRLTWGWRVPARLAVFLAGCAGVGAAQPMLQLHGQPYFDGAMTMSVTAADDVGATVWVALGLDPLPLHAPVMTGKGPYYLGTLVSAFPVGVVPASGRLDVPFVMPSVMPGFEGVHVPVQAYVAGALSNPATLPLDMPYYQPQETLTIVHPIPAKQANFGDRVAVGDLDDDGAPDLVVAAWTDTVNGVFQAGRVYVFWGSDFTNWTVLSPLPPVHPAAVFGASVTVADFTGDGVDDLLVGQGASYPTIPDGPGYLHIYAGGPTFSPVPAITLPSQETGVVVASYGRRLTAGDYNDDGAMDIAVGLPTAPLGHTPSVGRVEVLWGPTFATLTEIANPAAAEGDFFGSALATADLNGDGIDDLVESSGRDDLDGLSNVGSVHTFHGPGLLLALAIPYPLPSAVQARFGDIVSARDIDGDGLAEILTADDYDHAFILWAGGGGGYTLVHRPAVLAANPFGETGYGHWVIAADVNDDAIGDVLVSDFADGELSCPLLSSGVLYMTLGPYYSTHYRHSEPTPECLSSYSARITPCQLDGDGPTELVVSATTGDCGSIVNCGRILILDR